ncbi:MAG: hypothetical protein EXR36_08600 [Betaproteobacteria bacterium]|nr:hypothetical protein [Betaproteobacteria bacterium]
MHPSGQSGQEGNRIVRLLRSILVGLTLGVAPLPSAFAHGVTLVVHHFLPAGSAFHTQFLLPWTQKLEKESAGVLRFRFYPAMQMGGEPAQLADQAADRSADIVLTLSRHAPGRFPAMEAFEVAPFQHSAQGASRAAWEYFRLNGLAEKEFDELRLLAVGLMPSTSKDKASDVGLLLMNRRSYKALTEILRGVMNANSGADTSEWLAKALGGQVPNGSTRQSLDTWIEDATKRGLNGKALAESARSLIAQHDK